MKENWEWEWEYWYGNGREWELKTHSRSPLLNSGRLLASKLTDKTDEGQNSVHVFSMSACTKPRTVDIAQNIRVSYASFVVLCVHAGLFAYKARTSRCGVSAQIRCRPATASW